MRRKLLALPFSPLSLLVDKVHLERILALILASLVVEGTQKVPEPLENVVEHAHPGVIPEAPEQARINDLTLFIFFR